MTHICKPYIFKVVLFLELLNSLELHKSRGKMSIFFLIYQKNIFQFFPKIWGLYLVEGLGDCLNGLGLGSALDKIHVDLNAILVYQQMFKVQ